jgi:hypothetical protein
VYAVELKDVTTLNSTERAEGLGVFFHERCFPAWSERYRQKSMPPNIDDGDD